jgi:hypothetical protein
MNKRERKMVRSVRDRENSLKRDIEERDIEER